MVLNKFVWVNIKERERECKWMCEYVWWELVPLCDIEYDEDGTGAGDVAGNDNTYDNDDDDDCGD